MIREVSIEKKSTRVISVELDCSGNRSASGDLAEFEETVKHGAVLSDVKSLHTFCIIVHIVRPNVPTIRMGTGWEKGLIT